MRLNDISHLKLNLDIDSKKLKSELNTLNDLYRYKNYSSRVFGVKRKYKKAWSGISLYGTNGDINDDIHDKEKNRGFAFVKPTELQKVVPYMYDIVNKIYGNSTKSIVRLMRIAPKSSLFWHSHVQELRQDKTMLTIQIPIKCPKGFKYCVVDKDEFKWWKRFHKPNWFKSLSEFEMEECKAYYFNSFHYHNVYNPTDEYRTALMFYVDYNHPHIKELINKSL
tara:strand:- start:49 stop:717 length:669 start_codon:yes stop_codon:yes gene_type:complete